MSQTIIIFCCLTGFVVQDNVEKLLKELGEMSVKFRNNFRAMKS